MTITKEEAAVILELANVVLWEGVGPEFEPLVVRIDKEFPGLISELGLTGLIGDSK